MIGLVMILASFAHAQYSAYPAAGGFGGAPGIAAMSGCAYLNGTRFETVSVPGCTIKRISPSGDAVTYQVKLQVYGGPGSKPNTIEKTYSQTLQKENGKVVSVTSFEGEDPKKAATSTTTMMNQTASLGNSGLMQVRVNQRENGKESKFMVYDRNLCARFKEAGDLQQGAQVISTCSVVMGKYEDAAAEWEAQLKKDKTALGVMAGISKQGPVFRPARTGALNDMMQLVTACQQYNPETIYSYPAQGGYTDSAPSPNPAPNSGPSESCPDCRPASAKTSM